VTTGPALPTEAIRTPTTAAAVAKVLADDGYRESASRLGVAMVRDAVDGPLLEELELAGPADSSPGRPSTRL